MCWMAYFAPGFELPEENLRSAFTSNSHGAGFAYTENGSLHVRKGLMKFADFYEEFSKISNENHRIVHFRLGTGGKHGETNCHPFVVTEDICFAHNGIFSGISSTTDHSDTYIFNEKYIKPLMDDGNYKRIQRPEIKWMLDEAIGTNKLLFLDKDGEVTIINPQAGHWDDTDKRVWYSGQSHKVYKHNGTRWNGHHHNNHTNNNNSSKWAENNNLSNKPIGTTEEYSEWLKRHFGNYMASLEKEAKSEATKEATSTVANAS